MTRTALLLVSAVGLCPALALSVLVAALVRWWDNCDSRILAMTVFSYALLLSLTASAALCPSWAPVATLIIAAVVSAHAFGMLWLFLRARRMDN